MAHGVWLAEGTRQRGRGSQWPRDVGRWQDAVRRRMGKPVVFPLVAWCVAAKTRRDPAWFPSRQHSMGARRLDTGRRSGRRGDRRRQGGSADARGEGRPQEAWRKRVWRRNGGRRGRLVLLDRLIRRGSDRDSSGAVALIDAVRPPWNNPQRAL